MPRKKSYITVTDQFCGAGGSSQGVRNVSKRIKGIEVKLALNHWKLAIETHNTNFPNTIHDCTDISASDPRRYPSTDILITSPECTNHSLANGKKKLSQQMNLFEKGILDPAAERSRATMWDVPRFAEYHNYNAIIVENVVDARKWVMFESWLHAMRSLGYDHKCVYLNSMHCHPTPQSRDRMYVVFWKKGNRAPKLDYTPSAYCPKCEKDIEAIQSWKNGKNAGKYKQQYVYCCPHCSSVVEPYYYAAFNCIDWSDIGTRIGDRKKPLSPKTITRIEYGLKKYGSQPMAVVNYSPGYCKPVIDTTGTIKTKDSHGLLTPLILHSMYGPEARGVVRSAADPCFTHTTIPSQAIVTPFIIKQEHSYQMNVRSSNDPIATQTTTQSMAFVAPFLVDGTYDPKPSRTIALNNHFNTISTHHRTGLITPLLVENKGQSKSHPVSDPTGCLTTKPHLGLVTNKAWNSFISYYYGISEASHISETINTISTKDRGWLISDVQPRLEDCYYRMLKPGEIQLAMAFDQDYIVLGSGKDKVKQLGNAVTPPAMEWLVGQVVDSLK